MERILATYRITASESESRVRAEALAAEQSVEMPVAAIGDDRVLEEVVATVESIRPHAGYFDVVLGIAPSTTGEEPSQLMNMLFGNCSLQPEVELIDVKFPAAFAARFAGPRFGIAGVREATGVQGRPLTCTALKPQGSSVEHLAHLARTFALAGLDVIKDDHGIADQADHPFAKRVPAVQRAIAEANRESGGNTLYAPTFSGGARALAELQAELDFPVMAHPAFAGASRIAPAVLLGTLLRLFGADAVIFPNHGGRFSYSRETCLDIARRAREPWDNMRPCLPVPAGGMSVERVGEMVSGYGEDVMLLIGGGLLSARERLSEKSRDFVQAVRGT